jgi:hypothetical protein
VERLRALVSLRRLLGAWCLTMVGASVLLGLDVQLRSPPAGEGIVSLERAGTASRAGAILEAWRKDGAIGEARASLIVDFPFLAAYSTAFALTILWLAFQDWSALGLLGTALRGLGVVVALLQWAAAGFDAIEDIALLWQLASGPTDLLAWWAARAARIKFGLLQAGASYIIVAGLAQAVAVQQRFPLVQYLYFCRFPLVSLLMLIGLSPFCILTVPTLFRNLFALDGGGLAVVTALAVLLAWGILLTLLNLLRFAPLRFGVPALPEAPLSWLHRRRFALALTFAAPVVLVAALFEDGHRLGAAFALAAGLAAALAVLVVAEVLQARWGDRIHPPGEKVFESGLVSEEPGAKADGPARPRAAGGWLRRLAPRFPGYFAEGRILPGHVHAGSFLGVTMLFYFGLYYPLRPDVHWLSLPALAYVLVLLTAQAWLLPGLSFFLDRFRLPTLLILATALFVSSTLLKVDHFYRVMPSPSGVPRAATPMEALAANDARLGADRPVVVVAASGGGIRAAVWTAHVLSQLERPENLGPEFPRAVRLVSAVSGGSVGTMFYLDAFGAPPAPGAAGPVVDSGVNGLDAAAWGFAYADLWRAFFPVIFTLTDRGVDRGWALEEVWRRRLSDADLRISAWRRQVADGSLPPAVMNATLAETGEQLLLTPLEVPRAWRARSLREPAGLLDLRVSTAARLSATFPWVSPMATAGLDQDGRRLARPEQPGAHVGDGGYYDNFGVVTAVHWVETVLAGRESALGSRGILLVVISATPLGRAEFDELAPKGEQGWLYATVGPLVTLSRVRSSTQLARNRVELDLLQQKWRSRGVPFTYVIFEPAGPGPLSWKLTDRERERVLAYWGESPNPERLADLRRCFLDIRGCQGEPGPPMPKGPALLGSPQPSR